MSIYSISELSVSLDHSINVLHKTLAFEESEMSSSSVYQDIYHCVKQNKTKKDQAHKTIPMTPGITRNHHPDVNGHCLTYGG